MKLKTSTGKLKKKALEGSFLIFKNTKSQLEIEEVQAQLPPRDNHIRTSNGAGI